jgi:hypothetical protein
MGWDRSTVKRAVRLHEEFEDGHVRGERTPSLPIPPGQLCPDLAANLHEEGPRIEYVVYSSATPIAWVLDDGIPCVVDQYFNDETHGLQNLLRRVWHCYKHVTVPHVG